MNLITEIFKTIKSIFLIPINISSISENMKDLKLIENKIDLLTQKVNDLTLKSTLEKQEKRFSCQELSESEKLQISNEISTVFENHF